MFRTIFTTLRALLKSGLRATQLCIRSDTASYTTFLGQAHVRHQHQSWRERWMTRENLFTNVFEWNFIFKVALLFVGCSVSNQREILEMLGVEFTIFSQRIIASLTFWSRFKKLFYFHFIVVVGSCFDQLSSLLFSCPSRSIPTYLTDWVSESSKKKVAVLLDFVQMRGGGEGPAQIFRQLFTNCI